MFNKWKSRGLIALLYMVGMGLAYYMLEYGDHVELLYNEELGVNTMPFDMKFRVEALFGMVAIYLFATATYMIVECKKRWRIVVYTLAVFACSALCYPYIRGSAHIWIDLRLKDMGIALPVPMWKISMYFEYMIYMLMISVFAYLMYSKWYLDIKEMNCIYEERLFDLDRGIDIDTKSYVVWDERNESPKLQNSICTLLIFYGVANLLLNAFTNFWYIAMCACSMAGLFIWIRQLEKIWSQHFGNWKEYNQYDA